MKNKLKTSKNQNKILSKKIWNPSKKKTGEITRWIPEWIPGGIFTEILKQNIDFFQDFFQENSFKKNQDKSLKEFLRQT